MEGESEETIVSQGEHEARPYQVQLLETAIEKNTIVLLGTGAGKTFIAVMLIKQLSAPTLLPFDERGAKRTVFLVNTVPLVTQQAEYIQKHTPLQVGKYWGEMGVDSWSADKWDAEFSHHNILVMTRQIFLNTLSHSFVQISRINLIVFDECHHAVKNDPYKRIMKEFYHKCPLQDRPHVLGLSASIISGKCKPGALQTKLRDLEATLDCRTETAEDLTAVAKYATNPDEVLLSYDSHRSDSKVILLRREVDNLQDFLSQCRPNNPDNKRIKDIRNSIEQCIAVLEGVSISAAIEAAEYSKGELKELLKEQLSPWERATIAAGLTKMTIFDNECRKTLDKGEPDHSPKLNELLRVLDDAIRPNRDKLCGIIFVQMRSTAVCLSQTINKISQDFSLQIRSDYVVGHGAIKKTSEGGSANMNVKKQQAVLKKFRDETINLLVATSVVEEGLDVRKCNLVVRYDFPLTFQSYVQSKGRARSKNSRYLLLVDSTSYTSCRTKLTEYESIESELQSICHNRTVPNEDEIEERLKGHYHPFMPLGMEGPKITIDGSLSLIHTYCQKLPHDQFTVSSPSFDCETIENGGICHLDGEYYADMFIVTVGFPMNCPVKDKVKGPALPSFKLAKKAAALAAIEKLYREGELDDHLKPVSHKEVDSDEEDCEKMSRKKKNNAGTTKTYMYYRNEVAECLKNSQPLVGSHDNILYVFIMTHKDTGHFYRNNGGQTFQTLGILTSKPIPDHKIPEFSLFVGRTATINVSLFKQPFGSVTVEDLLKYRRFHSTLFKRVLKINRFEDSFNEDRGGVSRGYLMVPVSFVAGENPFCFVDEETLQYVIKFGDNIGNPPPKHWNGPHGSLISKAYTQELAKGQPRLYEVVGINPRETPSSPFPHDRSITYAKYFAQKYSHVFCDLRQFSIKCRPFSTSERKLQLTTNRFKDEHSVHWNEDIVLFPELCNVHPLSADIMHLFQCVPAILHRIESLLLLEEFSDTVTKLTNIGLTATSDSLVTTITNVPAKEDNKRKPMSAYYPIQNGSKPPTIIEELDTDSFIRSPDTGLLIRAFTQASADDCIDLERLEVLGDSFLKLATSVNLFCSRNRDHEGKLTMARIRRISNFNLFYLAGKKGIPGKILSKKFEPLSSWIPPCFAPSDVNGPLQVEPLSFQNEKACLYHKVSDKGVADVVEALLGAYIVAGGLEAGFKFLDFVGVKMEYPLPEDRTSSAPREVNMSRVTSPSQESLMSTASNLNDTIPYPTQNSTNIIPLYCHPPPPSILKEGDHTEALYAIPIDHKGIADKLEWTFKDRGLLVQALTHPSHNRNGLTECYQRLEFLGDAVLDYLVTCYIYEQFPGYTPGKITEMRSALVNNVTFAEIAVKDLKLHQHLLHASPALFRQISEYVDWLEMVWKKDQEEEKSVLLCRSLSIEANNPGELPHPLQLGSLEPDNGSLPMSLEGSVQWVESEMGEGGNAVDEVEEIDPPKALGDVLESIAGALFLDSDMSLEIVWLKFFPFFQPLIEKFSNKGLPLPPVKELFDTGHAVEMNTDSELNSDGNKRFRCTVKVVDKRIQVSAVARTLKLSQKAATRRALQILKRKDSGST